MEATKKQQLAIDRLKRAIKNLKSCNVIIIYSDYGSMLLYDKEAHRDWSVGLIDDEDLNYLEEV
jgi:hypothetical protein